MSYSNVVDRNGRVLLVAASRFTIPEISMAQKDEELPWRCNIFSLAWQYFDCFENRNVNSTRVKLEVLDEHNVLMHWALNRPLGA